MLFGVVAIAGFPGGFTSVACPAADLEIFEAVTDCRYLTTENPEIARDREHLGSVWFPGGDLFRPLLANPRQARFYASWQQVKFEAGTLAVNGETETVSAGIVGMGGDFGIWRRSGRRRCDGMQVGMTGAIHSQFNLDAPSDDLINSDFVVGPTFAVRRGNLSARFLLYHVSSHLGDEFILDNPDVARINLSVEILEAVVSYEKTWWRVYGGLGYLMGASPPLDPGLLSWGFEFRSPRRRWKTRLTPVFGANFNAAEARNWGVSRSLMAGIEMSNPVGTRRYRILLSYFRGFAPFGQFFNTERIMNFGITMQFDF